MHVTASEAALAGVLITGATGWLANRNAQRATRARDHNTRIWEKQVEIYEAILVQTDALGEARASFARYMDAPSIDEKPQDPDIMGLSEQRKLRIRLTLFGSTEALRAWVAYVQAHNAWTDARGNLTDLWLTHGDDIGEVVHRRTLVKQRHKEADELALQFVYVITREIQALPRGLRRRRA